MTGSVPASARVVLNGFDPRQTAGATTNATEALLSAISASSRNAMFVTWAPFLECVGIQKAA